MNTGYRLLGISGILAMEGHSEAADVAYRRYEAYKRGDAPEDIPYSEEQAVLAAAAEFTMNNSGITFHIPAGRALISEPTACEKEYTACDDCVFRAFPAMCDITECIRDGVQVAYKFTDRG